MKKLSFGLLWLSICISTSLFSNSNKKTNNGSSSKTFNPDIGMSVLLDYRNSNRGGKDGIGQKNGFYLGGLEFNFSADIDAYFRGVAILGFHGSHDHGHGDEEAHHEEEHHDEEEDHHDEEEDHDEEGEHNDEEEGEHNDEEEAAAYEIEEVYIETLRLPLVSLKIGKFKAAFGKHNRLHAHAYPFIDAPLYSEEFFGHEGLADLGISASLLVPLPWYMDITAEILEDSSENFSSKNPDDLLTVVNVKNLWDITDDTTLEFGVSGANGKNSADKDTIILGTDFTVKWRPSFLGSYTSFSLTGEYIERERKGIDEDPQAGWAAWVGYQAGKRWRILVRTEEIGVKEDGGIKDIETKKHSALVSYRFSEFSSFRVQYDHIIDSLKDDPEERFTMQLNMSIGAHPAHSY